MKCDNCGSTKNLQKHHISYNPEKTIILCKNCHKKRHNCEHGVGLAIGEYSKIVDLKEEFMRIWNSGRTYKQIMKKFNISYATVYNWRKFLNLKCRKKYINGYINKKPKKNPMVYTVSGNGRVYIPKKIRSEFDIRDGNSIVWFIEDSEIVVKRQ